MPEQPSKRRDRQVVRILGILGALLEGGQPTVQSLAARFGTRRETIYRDLRALEDAGYPISGDESGCLSRPRLLPEARRAAPQVRLTDEEISALLWASRQSAEVSPFREALGTAAAKLRGMARDEATAGIESVMIESGWGLKDYGPHRETILRLVEAILRHRRCEVTYLSPSAKAPKTYGFDSYRLISVAGGLYCLGQVPPRETITTLAVDRILALQVSETSFVAGPGLDLDRYRRESFGVTWEEPMNVAIRFTADQAPYVRERIWHPTQRIHKRPDGGIELSFRAGGMFEIARWVLGWGGSAEVLRPRRLREYMRGALALASGKYDSD